MAIKRKKLYRSLDLRNCDHCRKNRPAKEIFYNDKEKTLYLCDEHTKNYLTFLKSKGFTAERLGNGYLNIIPLSASWDFTRKIANSDKESARIKTEQTKLKIKDDFNSLMRDLSSD